MLLKGTNVNRLDTETAAYAEGGQLSEAVSNAECVLEPPDRSLGVLSRRPDRLQPPGEAHGQLLRRELHVWTAPALQGVSIDPAWGSRAFMYPARWLRFLSSAGLDGVRRSASHHRGAHSARCSSRTAALDGEAHDTLRGALRGQRLPPVVVVRGAFVLEASEA